jgi:hypothetical protein
MKLKVWLASLLLAFAPAVAGAVTLTVGDVAEGLNTSSSFSYENDTAGKPLKISGFTLTFNNSSAAAILNASTWTFTAPDSTVTGPVNFVASPLGSGFVAFAFIPNFTVQVGEDFTIAFNLAQPGTSGSFSFEVAPVPLPAAGWMLLAAIGGMGVLARRRQLAA